MEYGKFLEKRRELIAQIIREGYDRLVTGHKDQESVDSFDLASVIDSGESGAVEFKSTLRTNLHTGEPDKRMEMAVLKTLAGFLNTYGGTLIVGVSDDGMPVGLEADKFSNEDKMSLHLVNIVKDRMGPQIMTSMHVHFDDHNGGRVLVIRCSRSPSPVFVKDGEVERFFVRTGPSTTELSASQAQEYIIKRMK
jgi:predicted HTH transcriptional regulator